MQAGASVTIDTICRRSFEEFCHILREEVMHALTLRINVFLAFNCIFFPGSALVGATYFLSARRSRRCGLQVMRDRARRVPDTTAARKRIGSLSGPRRMAPLASACASGSYTARLGRMAKTCGLLRAASCAIKHLFRNGHPPHTGHDYASVRTVIVVQGRRRPTVLLRRNTLFTFRPRQKPFLSNN